MSVTKTEVRQSLNNPPQEVIPDKSVSRAIDKWSTIISDKVASGVAEPLIDIAVIDCAAYEVMRNIPERKRAGSLSMDIDYETLLEELRRTAAASLDRIGVDHGFGEGISAFVTSTDWFNG